MNPGCDEKRWATKTKTRDCSKFHLYVLILIVLFFILGVVSADPYVGGIPLTTVKASTVSGGLYMDINNTWWPGTAGPQNVQKTFASIPNINNIAWARLYVSVYVGHMQNNYRGTTAVSFDGNGDGTYEIALGTENLNVPYTFPYFGGSGPVTVNDHMNRVTSDYLMWYDVTSLITSQTPKAHVVTTAIDGSFDGRIKMITLVVAYNDGDSDTIYFWVNQGHDTVTYYDTSGYVGSTDFDLSGLSGTVQSATLTVNHMASSDGLYSWYGDSIPSDPATGNYQGAYFGYNIWDMTSLVSLGECYDLSYDRSGLGSGEFSGQFYKLPLAILTVRLQSAGMPHFPPVAAFTANQTSGTAPLTVSFTDQSTNTPTSWKWEYRLGSGSWTQFATAQNPVYAFTSAGTYAIRLTAANADGSDTEIKTGYLTVTAAIPPTAKFSATPRSGSPPLAVSFTDQSAGEIASWAWDFENDGTVDRITQNPTFIYTKTGTFTVNLTVTGPGGSDSETDQITISDTAFLPFADFTADPTRGSAPLAVQFSDRSTGTVSSWAWDFNSDGINESYEQNPKFTYYDIGVYTVTLGVSGPKGSDSNKKIDYIKVRGDPTCDLTVSGTVSPLNLGSAVFAKEPNTIRIINIKNNGPLSSPATTIELAASDGIKTRADVPALGSGANISISIIDTTVRTGAGASIRYNATIDPDDEVNEIDETNNFKLSADKTVTYNGYKGKRYWDGGDITTSGTFDIKGGLVHSFGDSVYRSGSFGGSGWTSYTVTWSPTDLPLPSNATIKKATLYVPYTWDNSNAADGITISFNGESKARGSSYKDRSNFGAYDVYDYGLQTYDVTSSFKKNNQNTAAFSRGSANAKLSMYGCTLAVVYEDSESSRKQIFLNEGFDLLGADETGYATTPEEATAYVTFSGLTIDPTSATRADLITFVASGDNEGTLLFNEVPIGGNWNFGSVSGPQVAVLTRDVKGSLQKTGNIAAIRSTQGVTPAMGAIQQFLIVDFGKEIADKTVAALAADFSAKPLTGNAPLVVNFTDLSTGSPVSWAWDFENDGIIDNTTQNPKYSYRSPGQYSVNLTVNNGTAFSTLVKTNYIAVGNGSTTSAQETKIPDTIMSSTPTTSIEPDNPRPEPLSIISVTDAAGNTPHQQQPANIVDGFVLFLHDIASRVPDFIGSIFSRLPFIHGTSGAG